MEREVIDAQAKGIAKKVWDKHPNNPENGPANAARIIKEWDERGDPHTSLYFRLLGISLGQKG